MNDINLDLVTVLEIGSISHIDLSLLLQQMCHQAYPTLGLTQLGQFADNIIRNSYSSVYKFNLTLILLPTC